MPKVTGILGPCEQAWEKIKGYRQVVDQIVPVDESVARESDRIQTATPERLPLVDVLIASAARSREAVLVHRDAHRRAIPEALVAQPDLDPWPAEPAAMSAAVTASPPPAGEGGFEQEGTSVSDNAAVPTLILLG